MKRHDPNSPAINDWRFELDRRVADFESAVLRDPKVDLSDFVSATNDEQKLQLLAELIRVDLELANERGERRAIEHYLERFPIIKQDEKMLSSLINEEQRLRRRAGEVVNQSEYRQRFGVTNPTASVSQARTFSHGPESQSQLFSSRAVRTNISDRMPAVGDTIAPGLALLEMLGQGAFGSVFLAQELSLAQRLVAVKVSAQAMGEDQMLARLQHTNIVPIYSVHQLGSFRVQVMPYMGRTTFTDLVRSFRAERPSSGAALVSTINDRAQSTLHDQPNTNPPTKPLPGKPAPLQTKILEQLSRASLVDAVLLLGVELADGLAHAHERSILHRDIKPANILLTDEGRAMLLDFNLATKTETAHCSIGGTPRYMAPEQLAGLQVDLGIYSQATDQYSLCLVLYELLTGSVHAGDAIAMDSNAQIAEMKNVRSASAPTSFPRDLSPAIQSILSKGLSPKPEHRYQSVAALREDLARQLAHQPLKYAAERSWRERISKWARRHPKLSSAGSMAMLATIILMVTVAGYQYRQQRYNLLLAQRERDDLKAAVTDVYPSAGPKVELQELLDKITRVIAPFTDQQQQLKPPRYWQALSSGDQQSAEFNVVKLSLLAGELNRRLAQQSTADQEREEFAAAQKAWIGKAEQLIGKKRDTFQQAQPTGSLEELKTRAELTPSYGNWMALGNAHLQRGEINDARLSFTSAIGARPTHPWGYYYRAITQLDQNPVIAEQDLLQFIKIKGKQADVLFNLAVAKFHQQRFQEAVALLTEAESLPDPPTRLFSLRARCKRKLGDQLGADQDLVTLMARTPTDPLSWCARGETKLTMQPSDLASADADFDHALKLDPGCLAALRNKVNLYAERYQKLDDALRLADQLLRLAPGSLSDRAGRAVLLARKKKGVEAREDVRKCLASDNALTQYQLASALILLGEPDDVQLGMACLRRAIRLDPSWAAHMPGDQDLANVSSREEFQQLMEAAKALVPANSPVTTGL